MPKRSSRPREDENEVATRTLGEISGDAHIKAPARAKNEAAVALGRLGGLKGGKARAAKLSGRRRKEIAKLAAKKRWANRDAQK
jgi:hypothetical protein